MSFKTCPQCGQQFTPKYKSQKLCSRQCSAAARSKPPVFNDCEVCGKRFETNRHDLDRGFGRYCSRKCGNIGKKQRVILTCEHCGKEFERLASYGHQRFCSYECSAHSRKRYIACKHCGKEFWNNRGGVRVYCSSKCQGLASRNYVERVCETCNKRYTTTAGRKKRFCSARFAKKYSMVGDGIDTIYGGFTESVKEAIRKRDGRRCQLCGKKPFLRKLDVHHINYIKHDCRPINLISLCLTCHPKTNYDRDYWKRYFQDLMRQRFQ